MASRRKKWFLSLTGIFVAVSMVFTAYAAPVTIIKSANSLAVADSNLQTVDAFENALFSHMEKHDTQFTLNLTGSNAESVLKSLNAIMDTGIFDYDEYLAWSWSKFGVSYTGTSTNMYLTFSVDYWNTEAQEQYVTQQTQQIVNSIIIPGMSDFTKIRVLDLWVISNLSYDTTLQNHSTYVALTQKIGVCQSYAMLLYKLCQDAGIQAELEDGTLKGDGHLWNIVKVAGSWYQEDSTNNDGTNKDIFFLSTDSFLKQYDFIWDTAKFPACTTQYADPNPVFESDYRSALSAVVNFEQNQNSETCADAQKALSALPDSEEKTLLTARLQAAGNSLTDSGSSSSSGAVSASEGSTTGVDSTPSSVSSEPGTVSDPSDSDSATDSSGYASALAAAEVAVEKAETTLNDDDLEAAYELVYALNSEDQASLIQRLEAVQQQINANTYAKKLADAAAAVAKAESTCDLSDVNRAYGLVNQLNPSDRTALSSRLLAVQQAVYKAVGAVQKAEETLSQSDLNNAAAVVGALPFSALKTSLQNRLTVVGNVITAQNKINKVQASLNKTDFNNAQNAVNQLPEGNMKASLQKKLRDIQKVMNAAALVAKAEATDSAADYKNAWKAVNALPKSSQKTSLQARLAVVQKIISASGSVAKAEKSFRTTDLANAQKAVSKLPSSRQKNSLQNRINNVKKAINAINAVNKAKSTRKSADVSKARSYVGTLANKSLKSNLNAQLKKIKTRR